jgi:GT2 family glycosyltransferase
LIAFLYEYFNPDPQRSTFFTSNNFAVSRHLFIECGGFNSTFRRAAAEDRDFCEQWVNGGRQMIYAPRAMVHHAHHLTMRRFWRQHFNYGRGAFRFHQLRAVRGQKPIRVAPPSFYRKLLAYPFKAGLSRAPEISVLMWISQTANAFGFFYERFFGPKNTVIAQRTSETIESQAKVIFASGAELGAPES